MLCRKCRQQVQVSPDECTLTRLVLRCPSCARRYECNTTTGDVVEVSAAAGAFGLLISVALALLGLGGS